MFFQLPRDCLRRRGARAYRRVGRFVFTRRAHVARHDISCLRAADGAAIGIDGAPRRLGRWLLRAPRRRVSSAERVGDRGEDREPVRATAKDHRRYVRRYEQHQRHEAAQQAQMVGEHPI